MSLEEYKKLDAERLAEGEKSRAHYQSVDLPGSRKKETDTEAVRARIAAMKKEREDANQA